MAGYVKRGISIRKDQADWLKTHPEVNVSGLLQKCIDELMKKERG